MNKLSTLKLYIKTNFKYTNKPINNLTNSKTQLVNNKLTT